MEKKFKRTTVTSALPYANGPVHIGHLAGVYVPADIYVRYLRLKKEDVLFIGGSDEHGVPITIRAKKEGITPQDVVDRYHTLIKKSFEEFGISFDVYSRTTSPTHHQLASDFFKTLYNKGEFIEKTSEQYYDEEAKTFLADRYITGECPHCHSEGAYGDQCEKFLVGDLFDFWFEYREVVPKGFVRTLGKLAELTDRGVRVVFFTGNHDMWVGDYLARECGLEIHTSPEVMTLSGKKVFIAHGDNMKIDGQPMLKFLNRIFRSRTLRWLFSWGVHPDWALRFGHWWSGRSRKGHGEEAARGASLTEPYTGSSEPHTEPLVEYAREYSRTHAVDLFVFGHMHFPRDCREGRLHVVNLGCWAENPSYAVLDAAGELTLKMPGKTSV